MPPTIAFTRPVSDRIVDCELTHLAREPIDLARAREQHAAYEALLARLGCEVRPLPAAHELPDAVFVEDAAVVVRELAVITRPGAESRRAETAALEAVLAPLRPLARIEPPGTLDGGDVLVAGCDVFVGRSLRTNADGIAQLRRALAPHGYRVHEVPVERCLHLKSAVTWLGEHRLLIQPEWVDVGAFPGFRAIHVHPDEPSAANALALNGAIVHPVAFPGTRERLEAAGLRVETVDASELAKAEGAVTCCSVIVEG